MEKLIKSLNAMKQFYDGDSSEKTKKDVISLPSKSERQEYCKVLAEILVSSAIKTNNDFSGVLAVVLETLLKACTDTEADVRLAAEEAINRIIKGSDTLFLGKILLEFYKEIKRNSHNRSLKVALDKFANMTHKIRSNKCRPYIMSLLPALSKICERDDDSIQECLSSSLPKIFSCLGSFAGDAELKEFLQSVTANLSHSSATVRRTAALCIFEATNNARKKEVLLCYVICKLQEIFLQMGTNKNFVLGFMVTIRYLVPVIAECSNAYKSPRKTSSSSLKDDVYTELSPHQVLSLYETCIHYICHSDNNIITASLETLQCLLKYPTPQIFNFVSSKGLHKTDLSHCLFQMVDSENVAINGGVGTHATTGSLEKNTISGNEVKQETSVNEEEASDVQQTQFSENSDYETGATQEDSTDSQSFPSLQVEMASLQITPDNLKIEPIHDTAGDKPVQRDQNILNSLYEKSEAPVLILIKLLFKGMLKINSEIDDVRVSVKNLALSCIGYILKVCPELMFSSLSSPGDSSPAQHIWDILTFTTHSDPQIRGCIASVISYYLSSALIKSRSKYRKWIKTHCVEEVSDLSVEHLTAVLCEALLDKSTVASRASIAAVGICLKELLHSSHLHSGLQLLRTVLQLQNSSYWLVKVDMLELFSGINFLQVMHVSQSVDDSTKFCLNAKELQDDIFHCALIFLCDSDIRVRNAAAVMIVAAVENLEVVVDSSICDVVTSEASRNCKTMFSTRSPQDNFRHVQNGSASNANLLKVYRGYHMMKEKNFAAYNLCSIIGKVTSLLASSTSKHLSQGCIRVLTLLSNKYPVAMYPAAYGCDYNKNRPNAEKLAENMCERQHHGLMPFVISMLSSSSLVPDLTVHSDILVLAGNLFAGLSLNGFMTVGVNPKMDRHDPVSNTKGSASEENITWSPVLDPLIASSINRFFNHLVKLLSVFHHIISDVVPTGINKSMLPSLPASSSITSPLKRRDRSESKDTPNEHPAHKKTGSGPFNKSAQNPEEPEKEKSGKSQPSPFQFGHSRLYMTVFKLLSGAYESYKSNVEIEDNDRFCTFLRSVLDTLCQVLEIAAFHDVESYTEEILGQLKSIFSIEPTLTVITVQQLLKALFGTNFVSQFDTDMKNSKSSGLHNSLNDSEFTQGKTSFYHQVFHYPLNDLTMAIANASFHHYLQAAESSQNTSSGWFGSIKKKVEKKLAVTVKRSKGDKAPIQNYIRLFESLVIKSLKYYTMTSSVDFQKNVLNLLAQLVQLRVNYCLLDSDQIFIGFVIKQFEAIEGGLVRNSESLIPHIFFFLVLLSYEKHHSKSVITMPKIIQLCDGIMASGCDTGTHAIPSLQPLVHDLFIFRGNLKHDITSDLDTQREVIQSMLFRIIQHPEVLSMLTTVLQYYRKENPDQWKRCSRQATDMILPLLTHLKIIVSSYHEVRYLHMLFEAISPSALRPIDLILNIFFLLPGQLNTIQLQQRWVMKILVLLRVLLCHSNEDYILMRIKEMQINPNLFSSQSLLALIKNHPSNAISNNCSHPEPPLPPEEVLATTFLQLIGSMMDSLLEEILNPVKIAGKIDSIQLLAQLLSEFLLTVTYMCRSGSFKKLASALRAVLSQPGKDEFYTSNHLCNTFLQLSQYIPIITLLWSQLFSSVGYMDLDVWGKLTGKYEENGKTKGLILSKEIVCRGSLIMFADYISQNQSAVELMSWLIVNHTYEIIKLHDEPPIQDFISAVHRSYSASGLFVESVKSLSAGDINSIQPSILLKTLHCLRGLHLDCSDFLLRLLLNDWFLSSCYPAISRLSYRIASDRLEMMLPLKHTEDRKLYIISMMEEFLTVLNKKSLDVKYPQLPLLVENLLSEMKSTEIKAASSFPDTLAQPNKAWFKKIVSSLYESSYQSYQIGQMLSALDLDDILEIMDRESLSLRHLDSFIMYGISEITNPQSATTLYPEDITSPLLEASLKLMVSWLNALISRLPLFDFDSTENSELILFELGTSSFVSRYWEKLFSILKESQTDLVFAMCKSVTRCLVYQRFLKHPFSVLDSLNPALIRLSILCFEALLYLMMNNASLNLDYQLICLELFQLVMMNSEIRSVFHSDSNLLWPITVINCLDALMMAYKNTVMPTSTSLCSQPDKNTYNILRSNSSPAKANLKAYEIMEFFHRKDSSDVPDILFKTFKCAISNVLSHPHFHTLAHIPSLLLKKETELENLDELHQEVSGELLHDKDMLKEFIMRVNSVGWIDRMEFERTWTNLLGVLVSQPIGDNNQSSGPMNEEALQVSCLTISGLTSLIIKSCMKPVGGSPSTGCYQTIPRNIPLKKYSSKKGLEMKAITCIIDRELEKIKHGSEQHQIFQYYQLTSNCLQSSESAIAPDVLKSKFNKNLERRERCPLYYGIAQRSVISFQTVYGILPSDDNIEEYSSEEDTSEEGSSPEIKSKKIAMKVMNSPSRKLGQQEIDILSCVQFLMDLFSEWFHSASTVSQANSSSNLITQSFRLPRPFLCECLHSLILISDFFTERHQFEWMFTSLYSLQSVQPLDDDLMLQYLVLGMCKAGAILGLNHNVCEILAPILECSLSSSISCQVFALQGALYVLECEMGSSARQIVDVLSQYVSEKFRVLSSPSFLHSEQLLGNIVTVGFYIVLKCGPSLSTSFIANLLQGSISMFHLNDKNPLPDETYHSLVKCLEILVTNHKFSLLEYNTVVKVATDQFSSTKSSAKLFSVLNLIVTCMYCGIMQIAPDVSNRASITENDRESKLLSMEHITLLFDRIRTGLPSEARILTQILPLLLDSFFSAQDSMNKVIGEFVSSLQPYPELIVDIVHKVFQTLHSRGESTLVCEWVLLSLGNFTQRSPLSVAIWCLTCIFISASTNHWINSLLPAVSSHMIDPSKKSDHEIFYLAAHDFYSNQLTEELDQRSFESVFKAVCIPGSPYERLLEIIRD